MNYLTILEWASFLLGAVAVWQYGRPLLRGAALGAAAAAMFLVWGARTEVWAAVAVNLGFIALHLNNLRKAWRGGGHG